MAAQLQGDKFERGKFTLYFNSAVDNCLILVFCGLKILVRDTDHILGNRLLWNPSCLLYDLDMNLCCASLLSWNAPLQWVFLTESLDALHIFPQHLECPSFHGCPLAGNMIETPSTHCTIGAVLHWRSLLGSVELSFTKEDISDLVA